MINARKQQRLDRVACPGVMIIYRDTVTLAERTLKTPAAKEFAMRGRLQMATLHAANVEPILLVQHYMPAGTQGAKGREEMTHMLREEIVAQGTDRMIVAGDWNQDLRENDLIRQLTTERDWLLPPLLNHQFLPGDGTYTGPHGCTWIDGFLVGQQIQLQVYAQVPENDPDTPHAPVAP